ncbi:putative transferase [Helianthus anomalus]
MVTLAGFMLKGEIYSFGVVLLEILTGMKVFDPNRPKGKQNLVEWAIPLLAHEVNMGVILDPQFQDNNNHPPKEAFMLAELVSKWSVTSTR